MAQSKVLKKGVNKRVEYIMVDVATDNDSIAGGCTFSNGLSQVFKKCRNRVAIIIMVVEVFLVLSVYPELASGASVRTENGKESEVDVMFATILGPTPVS